MIFSQFRWHIYHTYAFIFGTSLLHLFLSPLWRNGFRNLLTTTQSIMTMAVESVNHHPPISTLISLHLFFIIIKKKITKQQQKLGCCQMLSSSTVYVYHIHRYSYLLFPLVSIYSKKCGQTVGECMLSLLHFLKNVLIFDMYLVCR